MKMETTGIRDTNLQLAKQLLGSSGHIEEDIILNDNLLRLPMATEPRRMTFIMLALCQQGEARYTLDTVEHTVKPGDIIIITDRHVVDNFSCTDDLRGLFMMLSVNFFYEAIRNVRDLSSLLIFTKNHPVVALSESEADVFRTYFYLMKGKLGETDNQFRREVVRTLFLAMFYDLSNVITRLQHFGDSPRLPRADELFTRFVKLVETHFREERRVGWYADQLNITPKYLSETVKQVSKRTPNEWIDSYVTLEARVLLKNSSKTIKEIAMLLNFPNQSFLGKFFKEHVGVSPSEYRKKK